MISQQGLMIRLLQESWDTQLSVIIKDTRGNLYEIDAVEQLDVHVPGINDSMEGPLSHNERVLVIRCQKISQKVEVY